MIHKNKKSKNLRQQSTFLQLKSTTKDNEDDCDEINSEVAVSIREIAFSKTFTTKVYNLIKLTEVE